MTLASINGILEIAKLKEKAVRGVFTVLLTFESKLSELTNESARLRV